MARPFTAPLAGLSVADKPWVTWGIGPFLSFPIRLDLGAAAGSTRCIYVLQGYDLQLQQAGTPANVSSVTDSDAAGNVYAITVPLSTVVGGAVPVPKGTMIKSVLKALVAPGQHLVTINFASLQSKVLVLVQHWR